MTEKTGIGLTLLELAIGWPAGLGFLLERGAPSYPALELSAYNTPLFLHNEVGYQREVGFQHALLRRAARYNFQELFGLLVDALKNRRDRLLELAREHLDLHEQRTLGLSDSTTLDNGALIVYDTLLAKGVEVPKVLCPSSSKVYTNWILRCPVRFLDVLWQAGFRDISALTEYDSSGVSNMMFGFQLLFGKNTLSQTALTLNWIFEKGIGPLPASDSVWPGVFFYLSLCYCFQSEATLIRPVRELIRTLSGFHDPMSVDDCDCPCSTAGCLSSKHFLCRFREDRPDYFVSFGERELLDRKLLAWMDICSLDPEQKSASVYDACRLEVFDRLGMTHTCCRATAVFNNVRGYEAVVRKPFEHVQGRGEIQEEESELRNQLEIIMTAFKTFRSSFSPDQTAQLLREWWLKLHDILPDLSPEERDKGWYFQHKSWEMRPDDDVQARRARLERETLRLNGYEDWD